MLHGAQNMHNNLPSVLTQYTIINFLFLSSWTFNPESRHNSHISYSFCSHSVSVYLTKRYMKIFFCCWWWIKTRTRRRNLYLLSFTFVCFSFSSFLSFLITSTCVHFIFTHISSFRMKYIQKILFIHLQSLAKMPGEENGKRKKNVYETVLSLWKNKDERMGDRDRKCLWNIISFLYFFVLSRWNLILNISLKLF